MSKSSLKERLINSFRHSRESGNPAKKHWVPAFAGTTIRIIQSFLEKILSRLPRFKQALRRCLHLYHRVRIPAWHFYWRRKEQVQTLFWRGWERLIDLFWRGKKQALSLYWLAMKLRRHPRASRLSAKGRWRRAARLWRRLARDGDAADGCDDLAAEAWVEYGRCCLHLGRVDEAEAAIGRALNRGGAIPALARRVLAFIATEREDWELAAERWREVLSASPVKPDAEPHKETKELTEAVTHLARALMKTGQPEAAAAELKRLPAAAHSQDTIDMQAALARQLQDAEALHRTWRIFRDRFPQDEAMLQALYLERLDASLSSAAELALFRETAAGFAARFPKHSEGRDWLIRAAIAADNYHGAEALLQFSGGGGEWDERLQLWLAAMRGEEDTAYSLTARQWRNGGPPAADERGLALRALNAEPPKGFLGTGSGTARGNASTRDGTSARAPIREERILLFTCFRNERLFAPWFLDYYRALGVEWFFIVDDRSDDGTAEFLSTQKDVTLFADSAADYRRARSGVRWLNALRRRYGSGHWCISADADEQLIVPEVERRGLRGFLNDMADRGEEAAPAFQIDTFPAEPAAAKNFRPGDAPLNFSNLIDTDYFFFSGPDCCYRRVQGGVRQRISGTRTMLDKTPILRGGAHHGVERLHLNRHFTTYARPSSKGTALLHHKLLREMQGGNAGTGEVGAGEAVAAATGRTGDAAATKQADRTNAAPIPRAPDTTAYKDSTQLQSLGLLRGSPAARAAGMARLRAIEQAKAGY